MTNNSSRINEKKIIRKMEGFYFKTRICVGTLDQTKDYEIDVWCFDRHSACNIEE